MTTPTPRTEAEITFTGAYTHTCGELSVDECNARTAKLTAERDQLQAALLLAQENYDDVYDELATDCDELRSDVVRLTARAERAEADETVALAHWNGALERAMKAEAELAKYLSACPASPTEEERKRCQQWWSISGRAP